MKATNASRVGVLRDNAVLRKAMAISRVGELSDISGVGVLSEKPNEKVVYYTILYYTILY